MKLLELSHWFRGHAGDVVEAFSSYRDAEVGYRMARRELDSLFGATADSIVPLVRQLAQGRPISEYDHEGHMTLYTKLIYAKATAKEVGQLDQLDRGDPARAVKQF